MAWSSGLALRIIEGQNTGQVVELDHPEITIGRALKKGESAPGWVFFAEPTVSRVHAVLSWNDRKRRYTLRHRSKTNPTMVDGNPVERKLLEPGCTIQMGLLVVELITSERKTPSRGRPPAGRLGDAVREPDKDPADMAGVILEALAQVGEEQQKKRVAAETRPPAPHPVEDEIWGEPVASKPPEPVPSAHEPQDPGAYLERDFSEPVSAGFAESPSQRGLQLVVANGPDRGMSFALENTVMVIGQRAGFDDPREEQGILLSDHTLPPEQGMLVWQAREGTFGLLQSDSSPAPTRVRRVLQGEAREVQVDSFRPTLLQEGDQIRMGLTLLMVRARDPVPGAAPEPRGARAPGLPEASRLLRPQPDGDAPAQARSPFRPPPEATGVVRGPAWAPPPNDELDGAETLSRKPAGGPPVGETIGDRNTGLWQRERSQAEEGPRTVPSEARLAPETPPPPLKPVPDLTAETISGRETLPGGVRRPEPAPPPPPPPPAAAPPQPKTMEKGGLDWPWRNQSDFVFDFLTGPNKGCQIALVGGELKDDRVITVGSAGERLNEILIDGPGVNNQQALLRYRSGRFTLVNEGPDGSVQVSRVPLQQGDQVVLMTGDRVELGDTLFQFLERKIVEILRSYRIEVESGVEEDQGKAFPFSKQRLLVGRGKHCELRLNDLEVSRVHISIVLRDGRFYVQHRSETNPTFLNGISLLPGAERQIKPGDRVRLSSLTLLTFAKTEPRRRPGLR
ncbi:MAG: FHA domain-containing protein [Armatimonadetes bacterium]|nr:FHA domain-containing protein [Armatimonadota bacterium]